MDPDSIIRVLKAQYDKCKSLSTSVEDQAFVGTSKKVVVCTNCKKKGHIKETAGIKEVERKDKVHTRRSNPNPKRRRERQRRMLQMKAQAMSQMNPSHL